MDKKRFDFMLVELKRLENLKLDSAATPWGDGYNKGVENAISLVMEIVSNAILNA